MNEKDTNGKGWLRAMEVMTTVMSTTVTVIVIPWGIWVSMAIQDFAVFQAEVKQWQSIGPRFTSVDAENLRYKILAEVQERVDKRLESIDGKLDTLTQAINEHLIREAIKNKP